MGRRPAQGGILKALVDTGLRRGHHVGRPLRCLGQAVPHNESSARPVAGSPRHPARGFWRPCTAPATWTWPNYERRFPGAVHPLVRDHPVTGPHGPNLSGYFMESIVGMHPARASGSWRGSPRGWRTRTCKFAGGGAKAMSPIWGRVQHQPSGAVDHYPQHRRMRRCTVDSGHEELRRLS